MTMKRFLIFLFFLTTLVTNGQVSAKIGMGTVLSFTPASVTSPSSTATYSTPINFTAYVKNVGNAVFNGSITVQAKRDTIAGVLLDSVSFSGVLQPNDSTPVVLSFIPSSGSTGFKSGGNGNTIVVWPMIVSGIGELGDSARPTIWVNGTTSIYEFESTTFKLSPNPVISELTIKSKDNSNYQNISIYDVFARKVKELQFKEMIDVSELNSGLYWMIIESEKKSYRVAFIKQ